MFANLGRMCQQSYKKCVEYSVYMVTSITIDETAFQSPPVYTTMVCTVDCMHVLFQPGSFCTGPYHQCIQVAICNNAPMEKRPGYSTHVTDIFNVPNMLISTYWFQRLFIQLLTTAHICALFYLLLPRLRRNMLVMT